VGEGYLQALPTHLFLFQPLQLSPSTITSQSPSLESRGLQALWQAPLWLPPGPFALDCAL
jgi:hypothetical protein